ncbi:MAG: hypothetical protein COB85_07580 [Bacteroidetes bacterium]|nr:MAG: hypothetical protein COB85_07580 [Bacteroidota bacterium]
MLRKFYSSLFIFVLITSAAIAQDGALKGKVIDKETGEPIPFANIIVERAGKLFGGASTNFDGEYQIKPLPAGKYDVKVSFVGYNPIVMTGVIITPDAITFQNLKMRSSVSELEIVDVIGYEIPLISKDKTQSGETVTRDDIARMPSRDALGIAATVGGVFRSASGSISIRGTRDASTTIYIDGVKVRGTSGLPQSAIEQVSVVTGGIPAKYGDATGGIISITTRGPTPTFFGGVEILSSGFYVGKDKETNIGLDPYGYNLLGFNISGPLLKIWDKVDSIKKPLLSYFIGGEFTHVRDGNPSAIGNYYVNDEKLAELKKTPLRSSGTSAGAFENSEYITENDLEYSKYKRNEAGSGFKLSGKFDVRTTPKINLTFGGNIDWNKGKSVGWSNSLFNYQNNGVYSNTTWRAYVRFTQKFDSPEEAYDENNTSSIKNAFYTLHVDYGEVIGEFQDGRHYAKTTLGSDFSLKHDMSNLFNYGYVGKFTTSTINSYEFGFDSISKKGGLIHNGFFDTLYAFTPSDINPDASDYTQSFYDLQSEPVLNYNQVLEGRGLPNGYQPGDLSDQVYNIWLSPGRISNGYTFYKQNQFRVIASGSADILDNHEISAGFEYEQRTDRGYNVSPVGLWRQMRQLTNNHIQQIDKNNPQPVFIDLYGTPTTADDTIYIGIVNYPRRYDGISQAYFDFRLRQELGLATNGTDWIDLNALPPSTFSLEMFSPDELLNNGSSYIGYYGYDYTGNKLKTNPSLDDFFNQTRSVEGYNGPAIFDRPVGAYQPNYVAGYIQDKFAFKDLIFNLGLRVDRFDANQKVLKDPYLLFPAITAGEVKAGTDRAHLSDAIPSSIDDDYIVYVDNLENPSKIKGYRNGDKWYNSSGTEIPNPTPLLGNFGIQPYLVDKDKTDSREISSEAFEDYKPQTNFMPRIAFSFPISDEALFFAHYDILTRRPETGGNSIERLAPTQYLFMQSQNGVVNNPNLKPSKTVDYELGYQQKLNNYSSLKLSVFYKEMRDQLVYIRVVEAYPRSYNTWGNEDFGTVKGLTVAYDLRRKGNVRMRASYTLQFADGTGSGSDIALNVISSGQPRLKSINSLDWDQRHRVQASFDYHYKKGKDYNGPVWFDKKVFEDAGFNIIFIGGSGLPYSKQRKVTQEAAFGGTNSVLLGSLNGSRLPWQFNMDARIDKLFALKWGKENKKTGSLMVYFQILNVLNTKNTVDVYSATGNPDDDGYLSDPASQNAIAGLNDEEAFRMMYALKVNHPGNYSVPRRIRLGLQLNF